jgi:hypothetical protein
LLFDIKDKKIPQSGYKFSIVILHNTEIRNM